MIERSFTPIESLTIGNRSPPNEVILHRKVATLSQPCFIDAGKAHANAGSSKLGLPTQED